MCQGSMGCQCHLVNGLSPYGLQQCLIQQSQLGQYSYIRRPEDYQGELQDFVKRYFNDNYYKDFFITDSNKKFKLLTEPKMKITGKEYLVVSGVNIVDSFTDLDAAKKRAGDLVHSTQGSVYIFRPVLEIAPKRDVVETSITLG